MTPKEKAYTLMVRFKGISSPYKSAISLTNDENIDDVIYRSKQCALICVSEIIDAHDLPMQEFADRITYGDTLVGGKEYWVQVREEINKINI